MESLNEKCVYVKSGQSVGAIPNMDVATFKKLKHLHPRSAIRIYFPDGGNAKQVLEELEFVREDIAPAQLAAQKKPGAA